MHASCMKSALFMETKSGVDVLVLLLCSPSKRGKPQHKARKNELERRKGGL